jgi:hypothetical protein
MKQNSAFLQQEKEKRQAQWKILGMLRGEGGECTSWLNESVCDLQHEIRIFI